MLTMTLLGVALFTAVYSMVAKRLAATMVTAPMTFMALGVLVALSGVMPGAEAEEALHIVAEVALILLLFLDAAQTDLLALKERHVWPVRMLVIGLPGAVALGTLAAMPLLPEWPVVGVALVAAILAPTDAALGQAVVSNPLVPERVRRALVVESGLNDGLALPVVLLFASLAAGAMSDAEVNWALFGLEQVTLGPLAGVVIGAAGAKLLLLSKARAWTSESYEGIGAIALALSCYLGADVIGGNGFIASFVGGLTFGCIVQGRCRFVYEFTENEGQMLSWSAFFLLGLALVPEAVAHLTGPMLAIILGSLFLVRPVAIWLSLTGTDAAPLTRVFFGWFGPRGLATALFALLVLEELPEELADPVLMLAVNAVWMSTLLHGLSAVPASRFYSSRVARRGPCPETEAIHGSAIPMPQD